MYHYRSSAHNGDRIMKINSETTVAIKITDIVYWRKRLLRADTTLAAGNAC